MVNLGAAVTAEVRGIDLFMPTWPDVLWSAVVLLIIAIVFYRVVMPKFMDVLDKRTELIAGGLQQAEQVKIAAEETLAQRQLMLKEARAEATEIRELAKVEQAQLAREAREAASQEARRIEEESARRIESMKFQAGAELRSEVGALAVQLAAKLIGDQFQSDAQKSADIDRYLNELDGATTQTNSAGTTEAIVPTPSSFEPVLEGIVDDGFHPSKPAEPHQL
jgi:F-type H+-transporting ATPase subunit b